MEDLERYYKDTTKLGGCFVVSICFFVGAMIALVVITGIALFMGPN